MSDAKLINGGESGCPCLGPDPGGKAFGFSPLSMKLALGLSYLDVLILRYVPSIPSLSRALPRMDVEIFICLLSLDLLMGSIMLTDMRILNPPFHPQPKSYLGMVHKLFHVFLDSVCSCFVENICICSSGLLACDSL